MALVVFSFNLAAVLEVTAVNLVRAEDDTSGQKVPISSYNVRNILRGCDGPTNGCIISF